MSRRPVVALRPRPTPADAVAAVLDRCEPLAAERLDVALALALARHAVNRVDTAALGPTPTVAQVYAQRELRLTLAELARLVAPVEQPLEPGADDPELAVLVDAIRSVGRRSSDNDE